MLAKDCDKCVSIIQKVCLMDDVINRDDVFDLKGGEVHNLNGIVVVGLDEDELKITAEGDGIGGVGWRSYLRSIVGQVSEG